MSIDGKKILAITLARGGSKGILNKNMSLLNGSPLIEYTINEAKKSKYIDSYFVSTDNSSIIDFCNQNNIKNIVRPQILASDTAKSSDALLHAVDKVGMGFYYVIELMATNPFKTVEDIDKCIEIISEGNHESVVSVVQIFDHHPSRVKYIEHGVLKDFYPEIPESRRQDLKPNAYVRNGSIYAMSIDFLKKNKKRYDENTVAYIMPQDRTINIDEPLDLLTAKIKMEQKI